MNSMNNLIIKVKEERKKKENSKFFFFFLDFHFHSPSTHMNMKFNSFRILVNFISIWTSELCNNCWYWLSFQLNRKCHYAIIRYVYLLHFIYICIIRFHPSLRSGQTVKKKPGLKSTGGQSYIIYDLIEKLYICFFFTPIIEFQLFMSFITWLSCRIAFFALFERKKKQFFLKCVVQYTTNESNVSHTTNYYKYLKIKTDFLNKKKPQKEY